MYPMEPGRSEDRRKVQGASAHMSADMSKAAFYRIDK